MSFSESDKELFEIHLSHLNSEKGPKEFGLICYNYNNHHHESGYYNPPNCNIGDYIQSLAAMQFLPKIHAFVDRDQLGTCDRKLKMIMNAWYYIWRKNEVFSDNIVPLLVSVHLNNTEMLTEKTLAYFKQHEPVGCRDVATRDFLRKHGVRAYFSGCLTLTLGDTYKVAPEERRGGIYFVDFDMESAPQEQRDIINDILQSYAGEPVYQVRHDCPMAMNPQEKLESAQTLIRTYAHARLVVTSRIHCALPCLGLGVPVILACRRFDVKRYQGLFEFFNYLGWDAEENFINTVLLSKSGSVVNRTAHEAYAERLRTLCRCFCGTENKVLRDSAHTPSLQDVFRLEQYVSTYKEDSDRRLRQLQGQLHTLEQHYERSNAHVQDMEGYCVRLEQKLRVLEKGILRIRIKANAYRMLSKATSGRLRRRFLEKRRKYEQMLAFMKI